jgi:hypothetical protein
MNETKSRHSVEVLAMGNIRLEPRHINESQSLLSGEALEQVHEALRNLDRRTRYLWKRSTELFKTNTCLLDGHDHLAGERWYDEDPYFFLILLYPRSFTIPWNGRKD